MKKAARCAAFFICKLQRHHAHGGRWIYPERKSARKTWPLIAARNSEETSMTTSAAQEHEQITRAIQPYLDGAKAGKGSMMKPAFHENATVYGYLGDVLVQGPIQLIYDWTDTLGPAPKIKPRIVTVDVAGSAANVRVEVDHWQKYRFTDVFNLLKIDGKWQIVNKIFHTHA
jgi:hypothetical protein